MSSLSYVVVDVTRPQDGCSGCIDSAMNSAEPGQSTWVTTDGSSWWLRSSAYGEPNGDYIKNCYLAVCINQDTVAIGLMFTSVTLANPGDLYDGTRNGVNPTFTFALNEATELNISLEYLDHERFIDRGIPTTGALVNEALNEVVYGDPNKNLHTTEGTILKANLEHNYSDNG